MQDGKKSRLPRNCFIFSLDFVNLIQEKNWTKQAFRKWSNFNDFHCVPWNIILQKLAFMFYSRRLPPNSEKDMCTVPPAWFEVVIETISFNLRLLLRPFLLNLCAGLNCAVSLFAQREQKFAFLFELWGIHTKTTPFQTMWVRLQISGKKNGATVILTIFIRSLLFESKKLLQNTKGSSQSTTAAKWSQTAWTRYSFFCKDFDVFSFSGNQYFVTTDCTSQCQWHLPPPGSIDPWTCKIFLQESITIRAAKADQIWWKYSCSRNK